MLDNFFHFPQFRGFPWSPLENSTSFINSVSVCRYCTRIWLRTCRSSFRPDSWSCSRGEFSLDDIILGIISNGFTIWKSWNVEYNLWSGDDTRVRLILKEICDSAKPWQACRCMMTTGHLIYWSRFCHCLLFLWDASSAQVISSTAQFDMGGILQIISTINCRKTHFCEKRAVIVGRTNVQSRTKRLRR